DTESRRRSRRKLPSESPCLRGSLFFVPYFFASATDFWIAATFDSPPQQAGQSDLSAPLSDARITSFVCGAIAPSALKVKFTSPLPSLTVTFCSCVPSFSCHAMTV